ncbi:MAG TPA: hypothetical protein VFR79_12955 [Nitrospira sp.]|nr:hypothetical protein [Nitrospira sp.]
MAALPADLEGTVVAPATAPAIGALAEDAAVADKAVLPVAALVRGAVGTVEAPIAALPLAAMDTRLSLPVLVAWVLDWEEGAVACGVTVSLAGPTMGDWVGRFVSFRGREREEGLPVVLGLTVDTTVSVDLTSGAWR